MERVATRQEAMVIEEEAQGGRLVMKGKTIWMEEGLGLRERGGVYSRGVMQGGDWGRDSL